MPISPMKFRQRIKELEAQVETVNREITRLRYDRDHYRALVAEITNLAIDCTKNHSAINNQWIITKTLALLAGSRETFSW